MLFLLGICTLIIICCYMYIELRIRYSQYFSLRWVFHQAKSEKSSSTLSTFPGSTCTSSTTTLNTASDNSTFSVPQCSTASLLAAGSSALVRYHKSLIICVNYKKNSANTKATDQHNYFSVVIYFEKGMYMHVSCNLFKK